MNRHILHVSILMIRSLFVVFTSVHERQINAKYYRPVAFTMKCSACEDQKCEREKIECMCRCKMTSFEKFATSAISIGAGAAAAGGGVVLTILTGGLFGIIGGPALIKAGSTLVMSPIKKKVEGERMTMQDTAKNIALGALIGNNC